MKLRFTLFLTIGSIISAGESNFRTFYDSQGREMNAKLTQVSGEDIYIERMMDLALVISIFSKGIRNSSETGIQRLSTMQSKYHRCGRQIRWYNGSGIVRKTWKEGYGIELSNDRS